MQVGAEMVLKWRNPEDIAYHTGKNFRPLDTANLYFETDENSEIKVKNFLRMERRLILIKGS